MQFRDYQEYAIEAIFDYFTKNTGNPLVAMPTGTGKSVVIGGFLQRVYQRYPRQRIIKLTHVKELIEQNLEKLLAIWPAAPVGVYSAGLDRKELYCPITYAGIASAIKVTEAFGHVDLILIDECHLVSPSEGTMYQSFIQELTKLNPMLKVVGFTATHWRMGQGLLTEEDGIFTDIAVDMTSMESFNWFIDTGYLVPLIPKPTLTEYNTDEVQLNRGEFNQRQLQETVDQEYINDRVVAETIELAQNRNHWLVFGTGINHVENVAAMFESYGIRTTYVHSKMSAKERDSRLAAHKRGEFRCMVNNGILTTGYDFPALDMISIMRPTRSPGLWVQILGRGTRPVYAPGYNLNDTQGRLDSIANGTKKDCLVLDFAGNTKRLGPINDPVMPKRRGKKKGPGVAPVRICENCETYVHASLRECPFCHYVFPQTSVALQGAGTEELIRRAQDEMPQVDEFSVDRVTYARHQKQDRPPVMRVSYYCGLRQFSEYICLEHGGFPAKKARGWWRDRTAYPLTPAPATTAEALQRANELNRPTSIRVWHNKRNPEIMNYDY